MTNTSKGILITSSGVLIMSFESLLIKLTSISPLAFSFYIGIFMFFSTTGTLFIKKEISIKDIYNKSFKYIMLCAFLMSLSNIFFISAIKNTQVANVVIILSTSALFSSFFAYLFYRKKPQKNIYVSSTFIFLGLFIIFKEELSIGNFQGNIYALLCTVIFSISFVVLAKHKDVNRVLLTAISGIMLSLITYVLSESLEVDIKTLFIVMTMGLIVTPLSRVMIGNGTKYINASEVSLLMIIETIMAPIWVWIFLNEIPSEYTFIGGSIILLTILFNSIYTIKRGF
ncbi:MAG: DMT family transporter [Arcobacter sp.]|nr:DMT family transporter [Arcobacter sp.]